MPEASHFQYNINVGYVSVIVDANLAMPAFWAHPQTGGPFPGLVLIHDDWGLNDHIRVVAQRFAQLGYYVMAPDLFEGNRATSQLQADALEIRYKDAAPMKVGAVLEALEGHHKCNRKMAILGWDLGADLVFRVALERQDVMAAVAFYGDPSPYAGSFSQLNCPVLAIFGDQDPLTQRVYNAFEDEMANSGKVYENIVYPNAAHGFYNEYHPAYAPDAAEQAWHKVLAFLRQYQGNPPPPEEATPGYFRPGGVY
jgi:carboxymethylenebutenolidase